MRLLFCCEFYHPSRGGVQEVMRQIAERLVARGHDVTVATTRLANRISNVIGGVKIEEFEIGGNKVRGLKGAAEIARYQAFLTSFPADAIMIKAAQQWTFDAAMPVLDAIRARKVFIPCGFSGLYLPEYEGYFRELPDILRKWDHLIFYAEQYRDINFAREHGILNFTVLPNGASDIEFAYPPDPGFRAKLGIAEDVCVLLTVGTPINAKGHAEVAQAFSRLDGDRREMVLILNGEWPPPKQPIVGSVCRYVSRALSYWSEHGSRAFVERTFRAGYHRSFGVAQRGRASIERALRWAEGARVRMRDLDIRFIEQITLTNPIHAPPTRRKSVDAWIDDANRQPGKRVLKTNLSREDTIQAFLTADLFVFASNIEYSPLVLFEAAAAGTPFLTVPVGNAEEIVRWTGGGQICLAAKDELGFTRVDPEVLAFEIGRMLDDPVLLKQLGLAGRDAWQTTFNWGAIAERYEVILAPTAPSVSRCAPHGEPTHSTH